jgi:hypothetical protein
MVGEILLVTGMPLSRLKITTRALFPKAIFAGRLNFAPDDEEMGQLRVATIRTDRASTPSSAPLQPGMQAVMQLT